ncbi:MAG: GspH/FimT family pseudopilin [Gammaproteobacteria bacterium]
MQKESGFTLLELMVTVAIAGIVMAFAVPSMESFIKNERLTTQINTLVGHLAYARSESVTRRQQVILCASSNMTSCQGTNWAAGWILFIDADNNSSFTAGEQILRVKQLLTGSNTLVSSTGSSIIYDNRGFSPNSNGTFSLCDDRGAAFMKSISISNTGRVRKGGSASCT